MHHDWNPKDGRPAVQCGGCDSTNVAFGRFVYEDMTISKRVIRCLECSQEGEAVYEVQGGKAWIDEDAGDGDGFYIVA